MSDRTYRQIRGRPRTQDGFATGFSNYSGTLSYFDDKRQDEIDSLLYQVVSVMPSSQPAVPGFFSNYEPTIHGAYQDFVFGSVGLSLEKMADALDTAHPTSGATFGELMGCVLGGDVNGMFSSLSDATLLARSIAIITLGMQAVAVTYDV
jgi:hypothetical protein